MLIPGLVPYRGILLVGGAPGSGKTFYALEAALSISCGIKAFGRFKGDVRRVLYVGEDAPGWDVGAMCRKLLRGHGIEAKRAEHSFAMLINQGAHLNNTEGMMNLLGVIDDELSEEEEDEGDIETYPPSGLVILDSLRSLHDKAESSSDDMVAVMGRIKQLALRCCVMVLHHVAKPSEVAREGWAKIRGSGEIVAASDAIVNLNRKGTKVRVEVERTRAAKVMPFEYEIEDEDNLVRLKACEANDELADGIVKLAQDGKVITRQEIYQLARDKGWKGSDSGLANKVSRTLQRLVAEQVMEKDFHGRWKLCNGKGLG